LSSSSTDIKSERTVADHIHETKNERIYIGGIDPTRFSKDAGGAVKVISSRLRSMKEIEVISIDDPLTNGTNGSNMDNGCFLGTPGSKGTYFYATVRIPSSLLSQMELAEGETATKTAKDIIAARYHNRLWKGCRLRIETAKPHFLERLAEERRDKSIQLPSAPSNGSESRKPTNLPRNLRVKRRHAEEAFRIDTKPIRVVVSSYEKRDNADICRLMERNTSKLSQLMPQQQGVGKKTKSKQADDYDPKSAQTLALRAVHVIFDDDSLIEEISTASPDHSVTVMEVLDNKPLIVPTTASDDNQSDASSVGIPEQKDTPQSILNNAHGGGGGGKYIWSSSDDDSSDDDEVEDDSPFSVVEDIDKSPSLAAFHNKLNPLDEFSSSLVFDKGKNDENDDSDTMEEIKQEKNDENYGGEPEQDCNIVDDIQNNLSIFSKLFPSRDGKKVTLDCSGNNNSYTNDDKLEIAVLDNTINKKAPEGMIMMQRYDPTNAISSEKYEVRQTDITKNGDDKINTDAAKDAQTDDLSVEKNGSENSSDKCSSDKSESTEECDINSTTRNDERKEKSVSKQNYIVATEKISGQLYEQQKLETIFKDHMTGPSSETKFDFNFAQAQPSNVKDKANDTSSSTDAGGGGGTFSFSFNLGNDDSKSERPQPTLPEATLPRDVTADVSKVDYDKETPKNGTESSTTATNHSNTSSSSYIVRQRGRAFAQSDLDEWENLFFSLNEGCHPDAVQRQVNAEEEKEKWHQERRALTLDWKWKRSKALAHRNKKRKY